MERWLAYWEQYLVPFALQNRAVAIADSSIIVKDYQSNVVELVLQDFISRRSAFS
jgi:hypothetical protein